MASRGQCPVAVGLEVSGIERGDEPSRRLHLTLAGVELNQASGDLKAELDLLRGADLARVLPDAARGVGADGHHLGRPHDLRRHHLLLGTSDGEGQQQNDGQGRGEPRQWVTHRDLQS